MLDTALERGVGPGVLEEHGHGGGRQQAPHPDDLVCGAGNEQYVVIAHGHVGYLRAGSAEGEVKLAGVSAPYLVRYSGEHIVAGLVKQEAEH